MRFVMYGAGAIGGVVGAQLHRHGHEVVFIAAVRTTTRIRESGLRFASPEVTVTLPVDVVDAPDQIDFRADDVVVLAMKSQDTEGALTALAAVAPSSTAVVCMQNGVANERAALRFFASVYGVCVVCPALHLEPGSVQAYAEGTTGMFDIGRFPNGTDATGGHDRGSPRRVDVRVDRPRRHHALEVPQAHQQPRQRGRRAVRTRRAHRQPERPTPRRGDGMPGRGGDRVARRPRRTRRGGERGCNGGARPRSHGPARRCGRAWPRGVSIEADYLNGEIVLLGRLHGVPTPVNAGLLEAGQAGRP